MAAEERGLRSVPSVDIESFDSLVQDMLVSPPGSPLLSSASPSSGMTTTVSTSPLTTMNGGPPVSPFLYHGTNAVHMELQENAKLPTFYTEVDRSNSTNMTQQPPLSPSTNQAIEEMLRLTANDVSLTELFLKSSDRSSRNLNYNTAGVLKDDKLGLANESLLETTDSLQCPKTPTLSTTTTTPLSPKATPLSMMKDLLASPTTTATTAEPPLLSPLNNNSSSYYPYGRLHPLPIPKKPTPEASPHSTTEKPPSPSAVLSTTAAALETAAAIATSAQQLPLKLKGTAAASATTPLAVEASKKTSTLQRPSSSSLAYPRPTMLARPGKLPRGKPPTPPLAKTSPSEAIKVATKQRAQFGFGGRHVVPSVPLPPPNKKGGGNHALVIPSLRTTTNTTTTTTAAPLSATAAYERKKQRAKDSRVKLNESIDRLGIAINLAGSQTHQRRVQLESIPSPLCQEHRANMLSQMEDLQKAAEEAKKWDRPSFVGAAATVIQMLNSQCEVLMRELVEWRRQAENAAAAASSQGSPSAPASSSSATAASSPTNSKGPLCASAACETTATTSGVKHTTPEGTASPAKRRRLHDDETRPSLPSEEETTSTTSMTTANIQSILSHNLLAERVASFLDPRSLLRCVEVKKTWKDSGVFSSDGVWLQEAIERYGSYNVRQWQTKLDDHDQKLSAHPVKLYRTMDASNVKPYCKQEGSLLLGEARMPGKVSAWASMVERSNGETFRSVKNHETNNGYKSLPVVELRILIQNTGMSQGPIVLKEQALSVDASTRRRGEEMVEIDWDERLEQRVLNLDGSPRPNSNDNGSPDAVPELCRLALYEAVVLVAHIHAKGCSTTSKFQHKANFTKVLVTLNGTTVPLVIPFFHD